MKHSTFVSCSLITRILNLQDVDFWSMLCFAKLFSGKEFWHKDYFFS